MFSYINNQQQQSARIKVARQGSRLIIKITQGRVAAEGVHWQ
jgi:hypothetical protein